MVVSGMMTSYGLPPMGTFELAPVGVPIALVGLVYMLLARRFVAERVASADLNREFGVGPHLNEIIIMPGSPLTGRTLHRDDLRERSGLQVLGINHRGVNIVCKLVRRCSRSAMRCSCRAAAKTSRAHPHPAHLRRAIVLVPLK